MPVAAAKLSEERQIQRQAREAPRAIIARPSAVVGGTAGDFGCNKGYKGLGSMPGW
jgi:hypothetical protein